MPGDQSQRMQSIAGVCEPECPAEAILPDTEDGLEKWLELNTTYSAQWPNITSQKIPARRCR